MGSRFILTLLCVAVLLSMATRGAADEKPVEKTVVTKGVFKVSWENTQSPEKARITARAVAEALEDETVGVIIVATTCEDKACLKSAAAANNATSAIMVQVTENIGQYSFSIVTLDKTIAGEHTGSFSETLDKIVGLLRKSAPDETTEPVVASNDESEAASSSRESTEEQPLPPDVPPARKKLKPIKKGIFFGILGATVVTWATFAVVESVAHAKWSALEGDDRDSIEEWNKERDRYNHLRIASRTLAVAGSCAAVALIPIGVLTDFKKHKDTALTVSPDGLISIKGTF